MSDLIKRENVIKAIVNTYCKPCKEQGNDYNEAKCRACNFDDAILEIKDVPSAEAIPCEIADKVGEENERLKDRIGQLEEQMRWIPVSERLPDELAAVNITWVNHNPPPYYKYTKDVPLVDCAVYYRGKWYWWDATVIDLLGEYDGAYIHGIEPIDKDIEVVAWMPLPQPYKGGDDE